MHALSCRVKAGHHPRMTIHTDALSNWQGRRAPSLDDITQIAQAALADLPEPFAGLTRDVVVRVEDFPDQDVMTEMGLETPFDILGLYSGSMTPYRETGDMGGTVNMVFLYRRPLLDYWAEYDETLGHLVRHVLIHEIGHHMGLSDEAMHALEEQAD